MAAIIGDNDMITLFVLACFYVILGFIFAWVANIVANEEVLVRTGVLILVLTAVVSILLSIVVPTTVPFRSLILTGANFATLMILTNVIAKLSWKHSAIVAAIYAAVLYLVWMAIFALFA